MYRPTTAMVKFFTQCCPPCPANAEPSKCLSIIKGQIVPTRGYADDKKDPKDADDPAFSKEKSNEAAFEKKARKALEELKRQSEKDEDQAKPKDH